MELRVYEILIDEVHSNVDDLEKGINQVGRKTMDQGPSMNAM